MTVDALISKCCENCMLYKQDDKFCIKEDLPIRWAITRNLMGKGLCKEIEAKGGDIDDGK